MPGLTEQTGQEGYQGNADQRDAATGHQLLHALRLGTGIIIAVAFEQVDNAPDSQTSTQSNDQSLENTDCRVEKCHIKLPPKVRSACAQTTGLDFQLSFQNFN